MKCTDLLMRDHRIILRSLDVLQQMAADVENGAAVDHNDVRTLLGFLRVFADEQHHLKEESALFPELMRAMDSKKVALGHLLFEHDQERSLVDGLEDAVRTKKNTEFVFFADRLMARVRNHIEKEETILFPVVCRLLSKDQDEKVAGEIDEYPVGRDLLANLRQLESKYLGRVGMIHLERKPSTPTLRSRRPFVIGHIEKSRAAKS